MLISPVSQHDQTPHRMLELSVRCLETTANISKTSASHKNTALRSTKKKILVIFRDDVNCVLCDTCMSNLAKCVTDVTIQTDKSVRLCETELLTIVLGFAEEYGAGPRMVRRIVLHIQLCQNTKHTVWVTLWNNDQRHTRAVLFNVPSAQVQQHRWRWLNNFFKTFL